MSYSGNGYTIGDTPYATDSIEDWSSGLGTADTGFTFNAPAQLQQSQYSDPGYGGGGLGAPDSSSSSLGSYGNAAGSLAGAYNNSGTDTGSSVLSGAASGAAAGAAFGPWGAVIGGVIGGVMGFFGSKSKKKAAKKQFEQQMALQTAPERQAQANWLQKQGLLQTAMSNYASNYTPGGYQYKNALFGGSHYTPNLPATPNQPNFNVAPPDITKGQTNTTSPPPYTDPNQQQSQPTAPNGQPLQGAPGLVAPPPPKYTGKLSNDSQALDAYKQQYDQALQNQRDQYAFNNVSQYNNPAYNNGAVYG